MLDVWEGASALAYPFLPDDFLAAEHDRIASVYLPAAETWVRLSEDGGRDRVVGFVSLFGDEIGGLFVLPEFTRRGIGRALVDCARSIRETLEVEVFAANAIGRAFYARYGFVLIDAGVHEETGFEVLRLGFPPREAAPAGPQLV